MSRHAKGFTLIEALIGVALTAVLVTTLMGFSAQELKERGRDNVAAVLAAKKTYLTNLIANDSAWLRTVQMATAQSQLGCVGSDEGCAGLGDSSYDLALYDPFGRLVFNSDGASGFNLDGTLCAAGDSACPLKLRLLWKPACASAAADPDCRYPLIEIDGSYQVASGSLAGSAAGAINFEKYAIHVNRSPTQVSMCVGAQPSCPSGKIVCLASGWSCIAKLSASCSGAVGWSDTVTGVSGCSATISAPVLHGAVTAVSSSSAYAGSASVECVPNEFGNGLVVRSPATCASAPPMSTCPAQTMSWTVGGNTCAGPVGVTSASTSVSVGNTNAALAGSANFTCDASGSWGVAVGATCTSSASLCGFVPAVSSLPGDVSTMCAGGASLSQVYPSAPWAPGTTVTSQWQCALGATTAECSQDIYVCIPSVDCL